MTHMAEAAGTKGPSNTDDGTGHTDCGVIPSCVGGVFPFATVIGCKVRPATGYDLHGSLCMSSSSAQTRGKDQAGSLLA